MKKFINNFLLISILLLLFLSNIYSTSSGIIFYGDNEGLKYRIFDTQSYFGQEQPVPGITTAINFIRAAACPTRPEIIVLALDNSGTLYCSTWTSTGGWAESPKIIRSGGDTNNRWFDVTYTKSGDAIIVYSDGTTALKYTIWNGYWWENVRDVNNLSDSGKPPCWVTLASCPTRDEVIMVYQNKDNRWAFASIWKASPVRGFYTDYNITVKNGSVADSDAREGVTVTYESISGEGIIMYNHSAGTIGAWVWDGTQWSSAPITGSGSSPNHISAKPKPSGNQILVCYNVQGSGNTRFRLWNGDNNTWDTEQTMNPNGGSAGYYQIDGEWELTSGHESHYVVVSWIQSGGSYLQAGLLAKRWNGSQFVETYPVSGTSGISYNSIYLKPLTRIEGTASHTIQILANTGSTLNAWGFECYTHQFDAPSKQELETYLSRTTNPHQSFAMVAFYNYTPPDTTPPSAINDLSAKQGTNPGEVVLSWTATGDDGSSGSITGGEYRLRYSTYTGDTNFWTTGTWTDPQNKYEITWSTNTSPLDPQSLLIQNLTEGVMYYFRIWLKDDANNWSYISNEASSYPKPTQDTTPPSAISDVVVTAGPLVGEITVIWKATGDDGTSGNIVGGSYRIRYSTYSEVDWGSNTGWNQVGTRYEIQQSTNVVAGSYQTTILTNLKEGVTYYIKLWLKDEQDNWSDQSPTFSTYAKSESPSGITDLLVENFYFGIKEGELRLTWTATGDDGKVGQAVSYIIKVSTVSNITNDQEFEQAKTITEFVSISIPTPKLSGTKETLTITGLIPGVTYYFAIKAKDDIGLESSWLRDTNTNVNNFAMAYDEPPPKVSNLTITEQDTQLILNWQYNFNAVVDFSHFAIYADSTPPILWDDTYLIAITTHTTYVVTGLTNGNLYTFKVIAVDRGPFVLESEPEIISGTPNITVPLKALNFVGIVLSSTSILWSWEYQTLNVTRFTIYNATGGIITQQLISQLPEDLKGNWLEDTLQPNTSSQVSYIVLSNEIGDSEPTYTTTHTLFTFSNPPSDISLVMISSTDYQLTFQSNSNPLYTRYAIHISTDGGKEYTKIKDIEDDFTISSLPLNLKLEQDSFYTFKLFSYNQQDIPSQEVIYSTGTYDTTPPNKPQQFNVKLIEDKPGSVEVSWISPGDNGDQKPLYGTIELRWTANPLYSWDLMENKITISTISQPGELQSLQISGLPYNTTVYFLLKVIDDWGNSSNLTDKLSIYIPQPQKVPLYVAGLKLINKTQTTLTLSWSKVVKNEDGSQADDIVGYRIYKSTLSLDNLVFIKEVSSSTFQYQDTITSNQIYYYAVKVINSLNVESKIKMYIDSQGTVIFLNSDKTVKVELPSLTTSILYKTTNPYNEDLVIEVSNLNLTGYVQSYDIYLLGYTTQQRHSLTTFSSPIQISFVIKTYQAEDIQVYYLETQTTPTLLSSIEVIKTYNTIKATTINLGTYGLKRERVKSQEIKIGKIKPKVITPTHTDTNYNQTTIYLTNYTNQQVITTKIYDLKGNIVRQKLKEVQSNYIYSWDGKNDNGEIVEPGVYIYEIKLKNSVLTGTIIVAK